ncbi:MAG: DUF4238 domain-containing protein [Pirellulales bacterium]|nr:DUF4238 domain-containing protein [Pirellulales bacterium]
MGKHYVPQAHLKRFQIAEEPGMIWMYDKQTDNFTKAAISKVAQQADFYSPDVEESLAQVVEKPGNKGLAKLLNREELDNKERTEVSFYLLNMASRGPRYRAIIERIAQEQLDEVDKETRKTIEDWISEGGPDLELAKARLAELDAVREKFSKNLPQQLVDQIRTPFWSERTVECIHNMAWHILPATPDQHFVTSDTPAHFFEGPGLCTKQSEFTFPISKDFALVGEHQRSWGTTFETPQLRLVKEVNRRVLSYVQRFAFSPHPHDWIRTVVQKKKPTVRQIVWISR